MKPEQLLELTTQWSKLKGSAAITETALLRLMLEQAYIFGFKEGLLTARDAVREAFTEAGFPPKVKEES